MQTFKAKVLPSFVLFLLVSFLIFISDLPVFPWLLHVRGITAPKGALLYANKFLVIPMNSRRERNYLWSAYSKEICVNAFIVKIISVYISYTHPEWWKKCGFYKNKKSSFDVTLLIQGNGTLDSLSKQFYN